MAYNANTPMTLRARAFEILERGRRGTLSQAFDIFIVVLILSSVLVSVFETVAWVRERHGFWMGPFEQFCSIVFVCEYVARIWAAPEHPLLAHRGPVMARVRAVFMPLMIVDFISILPFFIQMFVGSDVAAIRIIRIVRFYRLARYVPAIATIGRVLANEWRALVGCVAIFGGLLLLASVAMYLAESHLQPDNFGDIPSTMWWAVVTLSTVGYGDVTPITANGKIIAGMVMIMGIAFFALPVGIIANGFQQEIKQSDFVVSFAMVARVPLFARLQTTLIARLVRLLHARKFGSGAVIVSKGEAADSMFFIASGEVEIELGEHPVRLGEGDFFGELALLHHDARRMATVIAVRNTEVLVLHAPDFRRLMAQNPELNAVIIEIASQREKDAQQRLAGVDPIAEKRARQTPSRRKRSPAA
jgi:voltage-gated potassium channel